MKSEKCVSVLEPKTEISKKSMSWATFDSRYQDIIGRLATMERVYFESSCEKKPEVLWWDIGRAGCRTATQDAAMQCWQACHDCIRVAHPATAWIIFCCCWVPFCGHGGHRRFGWALFSFVSQWICVPCASEALQAQPGAA